MTTKFQASRLNLPAFAHEGQPLSGSAILSNMQRLAQEAQGLQVDSTVEWQASAELRAGSSSEADVWLHLQGHASVPLTCQRCMSVVATPIEVDRWYRFVATEEIAMTEDDESEEDLLVMEPHFDLLALLEDELLMALPLVPMHETCTATLRLGIDERGVPDGAGEKANPFAVLAQLKKKN